VNRHARETPEGWITESRIRWGVRQAVGAALSSVVAALLGFLWQAVQGAEHQVERLTDQIAQRQTPASAEVIQKLTDAVHAIPTTVPTAVPARVVVQPAGPSGVSVTVVPAPQAQEGPSPAARSAQPSPGPSVTPTPSKAASGPLCAVLGLSCASRPS
jgi:hypothetical protein